MQKWDTSKTDENVLVWHKAQQFIQIIKEEVLKEFDIDTYFKITVFEKNKIIVGLLDGRDLCQWEIISIC